MCSKRRVKDGQSGASVKSSNCQRLRVDCPLSVTRFGRVSLLIDKSVHQPVGSRSCSQSNCKRFQGLMPGGGAVLILERMSPLLPVDQSRSICSVPTEAACSPRPVFGGFLTFIGRLGCWLVDPIAHFHLHLLARDLLFVQYHCRSPVDVGCGALHGTTTPFLGSSQESVRHAVRKTVLPYGYYLDVANSWIHIATLTRTARIPTIQ